MAGTGRRERLRLRPTIGPGGPHGFGASGALSGLSEASAALRFARSLSGHLAQPLRSEEAHARVVDGLRHREANLARVLEEGVFAVPRSPYRALFEHAGIEPEDALRLVHDGGVDAALERFHDAGVYLTLEEFRCRTPIVRGALTLSPKPEDLDNPLAHGPAVTATGGSRGVARPLRVDVPHMEQRAVALSLTTEAHGLAGRPHAQWRPVPPGHNGISSALGYAKCGTLLERWFAQFPLTIDRRHWRHAAFTRATLWASRRAGAPIPRPEHVPLDRAEVVGRWLADRRAAGAAAVVNLPASSAVRVSRAALAEGLDISGTHFLVGGEPLTDGKAAVAGEAGCSIFCNYGMGETGALGVGCSAREHLDEVHLLTDRVAVAQRERAIGTAGARVGALLYTTLLSSTPKLLVNVESDDYGVLERRACGCPLDELGLDLHLHRIRSYDKLQSEGMNFVGSLLYALVEEVLPARFGGAPSDYQLVEEEVDGLPKVHLVASPRLGPLDEAEVVEVALRTLDGGGAARGMMAELWRAGETLRVVRREPHATNAAKVLPLHVLRS